jgi:hypothetical protein
MVWGQAVICPLLQSEIGCDPARPLCSWCTQTAAKVEAAIQPAVIVNSKPQRACVDCGAPYVITSNRQQRCPSCRKKREQALNAEYQQSFRRRKQLGEKSRKELEA